MSDAHHDDYGDYSGPYDHYNHGRSYDDHDARSYDDCGPHHDDCADYDASADNDGHAHNSGSNDNGDSDDPGSDHGCADDSGPNDACADDPDDPGSNACTDNGDDPGSDNDRHHYRCSNQRSGPTGEADNDDCCSGEACQPAEHWREFAAARPPRWASARRWSHRGHPVSPDSVRLT
jgi:hypothetical protein